MMMLHEITGHQWVIVETMYDARVTDATRDEGDYTLTQQPSTTYAELAEHDSNGIAELVLDGGCVDAEDYEIMVYESTDDRDWCRIYIPSYWD